MGCTGEARAVTSARRRIDALVDALACGIGLAAWVITMASAPRYSYGPDEDTGNLGAFMTAALLAAAALGALRPRRSVRTGALIGLPALALSPWTTPRGDNDGLWLLIVPYLAAFVLVLAAAALAAGRIASARRRT